MKTSRIITALAVAAITLPPLAFAAKATSDLAPPPKRQATVDIAEKLANRAPLPAVPADLPSPFNPPDFDKPEVDPNAPKTDPQPGQVQVAPAQPPPPTDREVLEAIAARIPSTGTINARGKNMLTLATKPPRNLQVGDSLVVSHNNQDYELELVAIDRTTFTLRYRGMEHTRPIKIAR